MRIHGGVETGNCAWPTVNTAPPGVVAVTVRIEPLPLTDQARTATTSGLVPSIVLPIGQYCPQVVNAPNASELPAGASVESKARNALVPEMNPGMALPDALASVGGSGMYVGSDCANRPVDSVTVLLPERKSTKSTPVWLVIEGFEALPGRS